MLALGAGNLQCEFHLCERPLKIHCRDGFVTPESRSGPMTINRNQWARLPLTRGPWRVLVTSDRKAQQLAGLALVVAPPCGLRLP